MIYELRFFINKDYTWCEHYLKPKYINDFDYYILEEEANGHLMSMEVRSC